MSEVAEKGEMSKFRIHSNVPIFGGTAVYSSVVQQDRKKYNKATAIMQIGEHFEHQH